MTSDQLRSMLSKKFNVIKLVDIASLSESPVAAYKFFDSIYNPEYKENERIVIYTNQIIPDQLLVHIYQTANIIDISNWFVLFCTNTDISAQLSKVCAESSTDQIPFGNLVVPDIVGNLVHTDYYMPNIMCAVPWTNLEVKANGEITPCCSTVGEQSTYGHIDKDLLKTVFHGKKMNQLRQDFVNGIKNPICNRCWEKEEQGLTSMRQLNAKRLRPAFMTKYYEAPDIYNIDIKFQNTCNFKCLICGPEASSLRAQEDFKFKGIPIAPQSKWSESDRFVKQINEFLPTLSNIDFYGGEPFLNKKIIETLELAVDKGYAKHIRLHYNSNGSIWPDKFVELWKHFHSVDIHFSIDAVESQFEYQRGGSWTEVESNIIRIKNLNYPNMTICLMPTISIMNVYYIDRILAWAEKIGVPLNQISANHISSPEGYSLVNLTRSARQLIIEKYKDHPWSEMQNIVSMIKTYPRGNSKLFWDRVNWFDKIRKTNFADHHLEIANAMKLTYNNDNDSI